jgi:hypothetical protein
MNEEALDIINIIEFALQEYTDEEDPKSSALEEIGYITEERRNQLSLKKNALYALEEIKKYFVGQRTLSSKKVDELISAINKFFIEKENSLFVINTIVPFRLNYLP